MEVALFTVHSHMEILSRDHVTIEEFGHMEQDRFEVCSDACR